MIEEEPTFFRRLSDDGAEFAVHGYDHVDFRKISRADATSQFTRALEAYRRAGVACDGFRCPYLSFTPELFGTWPEGAFSYSSNRAVAWRAAALDADNPVFAQLAKFYAAVSADEEVSLPSTIGPVVEIPCSVPDDLELFDGLSLGEQGMLAAWLDVLHEVHRRGELFAPLFHPESFDLMQGPIEDLLDAAARLQPSVWLTQLRDVARWWQEKSAFAAQASAHTGGLRIELHCTERATVLVVTGPVRRMRVHGTGRGPCSTPGRSRSRRPSGRSSARSAPMAGRSRSSPSWGTSSTTAPTHASARSCWTVPSGARSSSSGTSRNRKGR